VCRGVDLPGGEVDDQEQRSVVVAAHEGAATIGRDDDLVASGGLLEQGSVLTDRRIEVSGSSNTPRCSCSSDRSGQLCMSRSTLPSGRHDASQSSDPTSGSSTGR
jgi:hypothetical protein